MRSKKKVNTRNLVLICGAIASGTMVSCAESAEEAEGVVAESNSALVVGTDQSRKAAASDAVGGATLEDGIKDRYIVVFKKGTLRGKRAMSPASMKKKLRSEFGAKAGRTFEHALEGATVTISDPAALQRLRKDPNVAYIERDEIIKLQAVQSDPPSWGIDRIDQEALPLDNEYEYISTGKDVHVYVIDSGVYADHNEFTGRILNGYDFIGDDTDPEDCVGHGTHVAGTAVGTLYGVAKEAYLHPVRMFDCDGDTTTSTTIAAIDWVTANHVKPAVVNMSIGGPFSQAFNDAVQASIEAGVFYAISAGNGGGSNACDFSPSSVTDAMIVGNSDINDQRAGSSNIGPCVDIFAPGTDILSAGLTDPDATDTMSGTSMAAPHIAGAAALLLGVRPDMTPSEIQSEIIAAATLNVIPDPGADTPNRFLNTSALFIPGQGKLLWGQHTPGCDSTLTLTLVDEDLIGTGGAAVIVNTGLGDTETLTMIEESASPGTFIGSLTLSEGTATVGDGVIQTADGALITAVYQDADDGTGGPATVTNAATVDCTAPVLSNVRAADIFGTSVDLEFEPSEIANVFAMVGTSCADLTTTTKTVAAVPPTARLLISGLEKGTTYYYSLTAEDRAGNVATDDNGGNCFSVTTAEEKLFIDFESGLQGVTFEPEDALMWHHTDACVAALPDHSATHALYYGNDSTCDYSGAPGTERATTPPVLINFDLNPSVTFSYYLDKDSFDGYEVDLIVNGTNTATLSGKFFMTEVNPLRVGIGKWTTKTISLSEFGTGPASIQIQFALHAVGTAGFEGFMVDDISIDSPVPEGCTTDDDCVDDDTCTRDTCNVLTGLCEFTPDKDVYEAETMYHSTGSAYTGGWNIYSNGYVSFNRAFNGGVQNMTVRAAGSPANGIWPAMHVNVNGTPVYTTTVGIASWSDYSFSFAAPIGNAAVRIYFTNDYYGGASNDRNLYVDKATLECTSVGPSIPINLGPVNNQTLFNVDGSQTLVIDQLNLRWSPPRIIVGIGHTDNQTLSGVSVSVNGGAPVALSGDWQQIVIPYTGQSAINLTVYSATPRALRTEWWAS